MSERAEVCSCFWLPQVRFFNRREYPKPGEGYLPGFPASRTTFLRSVIAMSYTSFFPREFLKHQLRHVVIPVICSIFVFFGPIKATARGLLCVTDDTGSQVCLTRPPQRVISMAPSLTTTVFDLGAGSLLVGRTLRCNEPKEALEVPVIGPYLNPDLERVIGQHPDLVLATKAGAPKEFIKRLTDLGIPVYVDDSETLDQIIGLVKRLGILFGREQRADELTHELNIRREAVKECVREAPSPTVVFVVGVKPLVVAAGRSFIGALIREAGGINIAEHHSLPYPQYNIEEMIRRNPEIILVVSKECVGQECVDIWKAHGSITAVMRARVYTLDPDLFTRPTPRIVFGLEQLAAIMHPARCKFKHSLPDSYLFPSR